MNNDLISREALKKALKSNCDLCHDKNTNWCEHCCPLNDFEYLIDNAPTVEAFTEEYVSGAYNEGYMCGSREAEKARPQGEPVIKCQDCKYRVKEWREDKRMKEKGYWVYGCKHFGEIMGYWGFGGNDNEFCSDAEQKGGAGNE